MKSTISRNKSLQMTYDTEKNARVCRRILLVMYIWTDGIDASEAARRLKISRAWSPRWARLYRERGLAGLQDLPRSGRPPAIHPAAPASGKPVEKAVRSVISAVSQSFSACLSHHCIIQWDVHNRLNNTPY